MKPLLILLLGACLCLAVGWRMEYLRNQRYVEWATIMENNRAMQWQYIEEVDQRLKQVEGRR